MLVLGIISLAKSAILLAVLTYIFMFHIYPYIMCFIFFLFDNFIGISIQENVDEDEALENNLKLEKIYRLAAILCSVIMFVFVFCININNEHKEILGLEERIKFYDVQLESLNKDKDELKNVYLELAKSDSDYTKVIEEILAKERQISTNREQQYEALSEYNLELKTAEAEVIKRIFKN